MATAVQIRELAATRLGILGEGETLPSFEANDLDEAYKEVHAQLLFKQIVTWDFDEPVPDEYTGHIVDLVAFARVNDYAVPNDRYTRILSSERRALLEIKELNASPVYKTPTPDYY